MSSSQSNRKSVRELELARMFGAVLETLPHAVVTGLYDSIIATVQSGGSDSRSLAIITEHGIGNGTGRFDLAQPLTNQARSNPGERATAQNSDGLFRPGFTELIFELKRGRPSRTQLQGYAANVPSALLVSLARMPFSNELENSNIADITWTDLFEALVDVIGYEAQYRLIGKDTLIRRGKLNITAPARDIGNVASVLLEEFLRTLKQDGLVDFQTQRVMVATGQYATEMANDFNLYEYPSSWDSLFRYLVIVHHKQLQYAGEVMARISSDGMNSDLTLENLQKEIQEQIDRNARHIKTVDYNVLERIQKETLEKIKKHYPSNLTFLILRKIDLDGELEWEGFPNEKIYARRGAITQSHRYFRTPKEFREFFTTNPENGERAEPQIRETASIDLIT